MRKILCAAVFTSSLVVFSAEAQQIFVGSSYFCQIVPAGTTSIISASSNTSGLSITTASVSTSSNQPAYLQADYPDGTHCPFLFANSSTGTNNFANLSYPLYFPANVGVSSVYGSVSAGAVAMTYSLH